MKGFICFVIILGLFAYFFCHLIYTRGYFGGFYIEQEIYGGEPTTWLWHNHHIEWDKHTPIDQFNDSTFTIDRKDAEAEIVKIKAMEKKLP
jgi:hypothetical protein